MFGLTDSAIQLMEGWFFNVGTPTRPSAFFIGLHSGFPGVAGASNELSGNGYARASVTMEQASNIIRNTAQVDFAAATGAWSEVLFHSLWSASSAGTCYAIGPLGSGSPRAFTMDDTAADTLEIPAHGFSNTDRVLLSAFPGVSVPTGLTKDTVYFVVNATTDDLQLSTTSGGAAVALTAIGQGTLQKITNARTAANGDVLRFAAQSLQFELLQRG